MCYILGMVFFTVKIINVKINLGKILFSSLNYLKIVAWLPATLTFEGFKSTNIYASRGDNHLYKQVNHEVVGRTFP